MFHGNFRIWFPDEAGELNTDREPDLILPNSVTDVGEQEYLKMIFQDVTEIAGGANWYVGLCNQTPTEADILADISTEPTAAGGYERQALVRSVVGWPTLDEVNGHTVIRSAEITFASLYDDFSASFTRLFLTDQATGTAGILYAYSGALTTARLIEADTSFVCQYEVYLD